MKATMIIMISLLCMSLRCYGQKEITINDTILQSTLEAFIDEIKSGYDTLGISQSKGLVRVELFEINNDRYPLYILDSDSVNKLNSARYRFRLSIVYLFNFNDPFPSKITKIKGLPVLIYSAGDVVEQSTKKEQMKLFKRLEPHLQLSTPLVFIWLVHIDGNKKSVIRQYPKFLH